MRWRHVAFFALVLLLIVGSGKPRITGMDGIERFRTLEWMLTGQEHLGKVNPIYNSGLLIVAMPLYGLSWLTQGGLAGPAALRHRLDIVAGTNPLLLLGFSIWLFYWAQRRLRLAERQAGLLVLLTLLTSMMLPDSKDFYSETLSSIAAFYALDQLACALFPERGGGQPLKLVLGYTAAAWFNPAAMPALATAAAVPALGQAWAAWRGGSQSRPSGPVQRAEGAARSPTVRALRALLQPAVLLAALGVLLGVGLFLLENWLKRGSPFNSGYGEIRNFEIHPLSFLYILVAPGKGILWYAPGLLLGAWLLANPRLGGEDLRWERSWAGVWYGFLLGLWAVYGSWYGWGGGRYWGPRYLLAASLFASVLLALLWHQRARLGTARRALLLGALAYTGLIVWIGSTIGQRYYSLCTAADEVCDAGWIVSPLYVFTQGPREMLLLLAHRYALTVLLVGAGWLLLAPRLAGPAPGAAGHSP